MEHKLISGGEIYLPFARSRIKALRATGLKYASQQFEIDGCSVKVRIEPGHEYISLGGDVVRVKMDTGVVDIVTAVPWDAPSNYYPRDLYEAGQAVTYNAPFTTRLGSHDGWRRNPSAGSPGQIAGNLSFRGGEFTGVLPEDGATAASFTPDYKLNSSVTPNAWVQVEQDDALWAKKMMATTCPASMFTGRCRLFVQALYGTHMYDHSVDGLGTVLAGGPQNEQLVSLAGSTGQPYLKIKAHIPPKDAPGYPDVPLYTSTGVILLPDGTHWMANPYEGGIAFYPLVASAAGEKLRKHLAPGSSPKINPVDVEHLEAYILSTCRPDVGRLQNISLAPVPAYSMGYGWHWNWSGTCCDIAINEIEDIGFEDGFHRQGMVSTHRRIVATPSPATDGEVVWSADASIVSGPDHWAAKRITWSVTEPNWVDMCGESILPKYGAYRVGKGVFYVFYIRDELQVCSVEITKSSKAMSFSRSDKDYCNDAGRVEGATVGMRPGWAEVYSELSTYYIANFRCGAQLLPDARVLFSEHSFRDETADKTEGPVTLVNTAYTGETGASLSFDYGYLQSDGKYASQTFECPADLTLAPYFQSYDGPYITYDRVVGKRVHESPSSVTIVVPLWDAEAVFFQGYREDITYVTARAVTPFASHNLASTSGVRFKTPHGGAVQWDGLFDVGAKFTRYQVASGSPVGPTTGLEDVIEKSGLISFQKLVCRAGSLDASMPNLAYFHGDDTTPIFGARSGSRVDDPVVISRERIEPVGTDRDGEKVAIVGWL